MIYRPSFPPNISDQNLADWLRREFQAVSNGMLYPHDLPVTTIAPTKAAEGAIRYADGVGWNPGGTGKGVYVFNGSAWVKL